MNEWMNDEGGKEGRKEGRKEGKLQALVRPWKRFLKFKGFQDVTTFVNHIANA